MRYLDLTLLTPSQNLACDEALLEFCEQGYSHDILRVWESPDPFVVLGYSNKIKGEVNLKACERHEIPVLRRTSGGGTVLQGPGCLNYALILKLEGEHPLKNIALTNHYILERHRKVLATVIRGKIELQGISDLTLNGLKFSGNAQRRKRQHILFHGTFLIDFDLALIEKILPIPVKQPSYRHGRPHREFLTNFPISRDLLKNTLRHSWSANTSFTEVPVEEIHRLVLEKYSKNSWNGRY